METEYDSEFFLMKKNIINNSQFKAKQLDLSSAVRPIFKSMIWSSNPVKRGGVGRDLILRNVPSSFLTF